VLADYGGARLDLADPAAYRDLSRPAGAQTDARRALFLERFAGWADPEVPPFHYGSHYSSAAVALWYLLRLEPYTALALDFQVAHIHSTIHSSTVFTH
jgi:hypothetical protein